MEDADDAAIPVACVRRVKLSVASNEEIVKAVPVTNPSEKPFPITHGSQLHDNPSLGLPLEVGSCESCGATQLDKCQGHFGFIELPMPIYHPSHITELGKILNLICLRCLRLKNGKLVKQKGSGKGGKFISCSYCQDLPPLCVAQVKKSNGARSLKLTAPSGAETGDGFWSFLDQFGFHTKHPSHSRSLLPKEVQSMMQKISDETRKRLAAGGYNLQDGYVMNYMCVPPNCLHTANILNDNTVMCPPDTSKNLLRKILRTIGDIKSSGIAHSNSEAREVGEDDLQVAVAEYMNMRGTTQGSHHATLTKQPAPKQWQQKMKTLFISKSSSFSCRAVITGDPYIGLDVVGLPDEIARRMSVEEHVTDYNIAKLQDITDKGLCLTHTDINSKTYSMDVGEANDKKRTMLKVGETVNRRVLDGDVVFLNRPPSTDMHSVEALYVHVHDDHTIKINPLICGPLGADFDGDCVQIFYPRSVSAKVEAKELFTVENQQLSSHNAKLNFQLKNDCLLALKIMCDRRYSRKEAGQIAMFSSGVIPPGNPYWTISQILQTVDALAAIPSHPNQESIGALITDIISSIHSDEGPRESIKLLNTLQPMLMESLIMDGFSINLSDFNGPSTEPKLKKNQNSSAQLNKIRESIVDYITCSSALGLLIDHTKDSAIKKLVEQLGFLGHQLQCDGTAYSSNLVQDCYNFLNKCCRSSRCDHLEANGFVNSSFYNGLNPYEEMLHSISTREKIMRTSKGLIESGNLFKDMMAILRDVVVCYDGTIRTLYRKSIVKFESRAGSRYATPGDSVGRLAATAFANAAYKAVLDPNQNHMTSWDSMKQVLLTKSGFKNDINDRRVILYLNKYSGVINAVQSCLKRIKVEDCATEISIRYQQKITHAAHCLVGYVHLDKKQLNQMELTVESIVQICQEEIVKHVKKKGRMRQIKKKSNIILSECFSDEDPSDKKYLKLCCFQFFLDASIATELPECTVVHLMTNTIFPILLETIIKGDPRLQKAKVIWIEPTYPWWVQNPGAEQKGELALEVTVEKDAAAENGDAWGVAMDACIPVMHLIDTTRSMPYNIQGVQKVFGISFAFDRITQHLSKAIGMVTKSVLKEHLTTVASSMTCTGNLHGFNSSSYKATFQSMNVQAPFTEATISRPIQCFQKSAEKVHTDQLDSVVSTCSWGNQAAVGTGSAFEILWNIEKQSARNEPLGGYGLYDFLEMVGTIGATKDKTVVPSSSCLYDVDLLPLDEMECLGGNSPIAWTDTDKPKIDWLQHDSVGRRTGMCITAREHQGMKIKSTWNSNANRKNNKRSWCEENDMAPHHSTFARSTNTSGCNNRRFNGHVFERKRSKHTWNSAATHQDKKPSWSEDNVAGTQNFSVLESSAGGWNRRNNTFGQGGSKAKWKSEGSHRGGGNSRNRKAQNSGNARQGGSCSFTPVEQQIYAQVDPIMKNAKRIIRESRDGIKLSEEDETFIVTKILMYHPEKEKKISGQGNYIMVSRHQKFHTSRCLYVASSDGSCSDFSYKKCLENFVRINYPAAADSFCRKYFK